MSSRLTPLQYRTLDFIATCPRGQSMLLPCHWRDRTHQALIARGLLRLRANPFTTRAIMLRGYITARGRKAVKDAPLAVRLQAAEDEEREYRIYAREVEEGRA